MKTRNRFYTSSILTVLSMLLLSACGGGGGSSGGGGGGGGSLATGGFTKPVTLVGVAEWGVPFSALSGNDHQQSLYLASDINGSGNISSISLQHHVTQTLANCPDVTIKMGHTSAGALTTTFADNIEQGEGSSVTVRTGALTIPAGAIGDYFTINLDQPFNYNGVDNLVVEFLVTACDATIVLRRDKTLANADRIVWDNSLATTTGKLFPATLHTKFNFAGGDNAVVYTGGSGWLAVPLTTISSLQKSQFLYPATQIDGSGPITGIAFLLGGTPTTAEDYTVTIRLGHSTLRDLGTTFATNFSDIPVTVGNTINLKVPAGMAVGSDFWIPMPDGVFNYNGVDNLIVEIDVSSATGNTFWVVHAGGNKTRLLGPSGAAIGSNLDTTRNDIKLRFNGGTMDVITDGASPSIVPVGGSEHIAQILYDSTALGTGGEITSLGFRLERDAVAFDHTDVNLVLGHTTLSALGGSSLIANIQSDRTAVFTGTISIPVGLKAGDWVQVPLSTPFTYDPTQNLVVQWDVPGFATTNPSIGHNFVSGRYVGHFEANVGDRTADVSNASVDTVLDMRLILNK